MARHVHTKSLIIHPPDDLVAGQPGLWQMSHAMSLKYAYGQVVTEEELQAMGQALWVALDQQQAFDAAREEAGAAILSVIIESGSSQVQEALMPLIAKGLVRLEMPDDGRFSTLKDLLAGVSAPSPLSQRPRQVPSRTPYRRAALWRVSL